VAFAEGDEKQQRTPSPWKRVLVRGDAEQNTAVEKRGSDFAFFVILALGARGRAFSSGFNKGVGARFRRIAARAVRV
jgi:hypothetical protein